MEKQHLAVSRGHSLHERAQRRPRLPAHELLEGRGGRGATDVCAAAYLLAKAASPLSATQAPCPIAGDATEPCLQSPVIGELVEPLPGDDKGVLGSLFSQSAISLQRCEGDRKHRGLIAPHEPGKGVGVAASRRLQAQRVIGRRGFHY